MIYMVEVLMSRQMNQSRTSDKKVHQKKGKLDKRNFKKILMCLRTKEARKRSMLSKKL